MRSKEDRDKDIINDVRLWNPYPDQPRKKYGITFEWDASCGFGLIGISQDEDGNVLIDSEYMNRDFVKKVLCKMVDDAILDTDSIEYDDKDDENKDK